MAIITIGYNNYVLPLKDAVTVADMLGKAERYEQKYRSGSDNTHHVYPETKDDFGTIRLLSDAFYQGAKLAGKPE
jgi:hypothetical protein